MGKFQLLLRGLLMSIYFIIIFLKNKDEGDKLMLSSERKSLSSTKRLWKVSSDAS